MSSPRQISICFYGSSDEGLKTPLAALYKDTIVKVVSDTLNMDYDSFQVITGGYGGIMDMLGKEFKKQAPAKSKIVEIIGITCDAYKLETPGTDNYNINNDFGASNDIIIQAESFPARLQAMVELADIFVVLPGKQGTLNELLITSESYAYPIPIFEEKAQHVKILVHKYWKNLVEKSWKNLFHKSYFRRIKNIHYFDADNFQNVLTNFQPVPLIYPTNKPKDPDQSIEIAFKELYEDIGRILYGKIAGNELLRKRLQFKNGVIAIDFGYYLSSNSTKTNEVKYLTYSTNKYQNLLNSFLSTDGSIMFNERNPHSVMEVRYLKGEIENTEEPIFRPENSSKADIETEKQSDFTAWQNHLESNKYGKTLIWRSLTHQGKHSSYKLNLSIFFLFNCHLPSRKIEKIRQLTDEYLLEVSTKKIAELFGYKELLLKKQATKAAISQVMARNSSHNIGSHVMNKLTNANFLENLKVNNLDKYKSKVVLETNENSNFHQLAIFNNYVKCRMDYLSDITFGTPLMQTSKMAYGELFKELDKVRLLLEHISGLSDFNYRIIFEFDGIDLNDNQESDIPLALPNDILGCQAFYNIIENVIRNTAKHAKKDKIPADIDGVKRTIFTVNVAEIEENGLPYSVKNQANELYRVEIFDNIPIEGNNEDENQKKAYSEDFSDGPIVGGGKSVSNIDYLVYCQNKKLNDSILKDDNTLRASSLGLIEMEASACYLRKLDIAEIESDTYDINYKNDLTYNKHNNLNIIKAYNAGAQKNYLGYRLFIFRPAEILAVTDNELSGININKWLKEGVKIIPTDDFKKHLKKGCVFNQQFIVYDDDSVTEYINQTEEKEIEGKMYHLYRYRTSLPIRCFKYDISELFTSTSFQEMNGKLWIYWISQITGAINYKIKNDIPENHQTYTPLIFLDHVGEDAGQDNKAHAQTIIVNPVVKYYVEALSTKAQNKLPGFSRLSKGDLDKPLKNYIQNIATAPTENSVEINKIIESAISKILIIDERIQSASIEEFIAIPFKYLYTASNIFIPENKNHGSNTIDLASLDFDETLIARIHGFIDDQINYGCNFCIIHYSILERMFSKVGGDKTVAINNYLDKLSTRIEIIITSGRGIPDELTKRVRYVNLSPITSALIDIRSKFLIHNILHSSRKSNRI